MVQIEKEEYEVEIIDRTDAVVRWNDGARQYFVLNEGDEERIINGEDPVAERWDDGSGQTICHENATD